MQCPECQSDNEASKKFCRNCGAKLQPTCPECGASILPADKFCGECGFELGVKEGLAKRAEKVISERKHITALFADLAGYTALSERLDPEEVKDLMSRLFADITKIILKY
jgi:predicted amidophosphoribosyltransferase